MDLKVYVGGSMSGLTAAQIRERFLTIYDRLEVFGYDVLHPIIGKGDLLQGDVICEPHGYTSAVSNDHAVFQRDKWMVATADILFMNLLDAPRVSIGSCMEVAWAALQHKHIVVLMEEDNVHQHAFFKTATTIVFPDLKSGFLYMEKLINRSL